MRLNGLLGTGRCSCKLRHAINCSIRMARYCRAMHSDLLLKCRKAQVAGLYSATFRIAQRECDVMGDTWADILGDGQRMTAAEISDWAHQCQPA